MIRDLAANAVSIIEDEVLIVEDDASTAELERRVLARAGKTTVIVSRVSRALELLEERGFAAILLDYHLPDGDPWAVVEAAGFRCPRIPVILVTGQGDEMVASQAVNRGVAAYLKKSATCWEQLPGILHRVTSLAAARERLRVSAAKYRLEAWASEMANEAKSDYLATMNHEIRTPLNVVIGLGYLLEQTPLNEIQREYINKMQIAGRALLGVVNNVLDLSKIEAGETSLQNAPFDVAELLGNLSQMLAEQAKSKGIELIVQPVADLPLNVRGDASRLQQILVNLVNNAIKFTEAGHVQVTVTCTKRGPEGILMHCEVEDTGIGIEPQALERLFQPFAQADATTAPRFGGTGLGLSISRHLVQLMGGSMGVTSTVAVGSTFWFEVPLECSHDDAGAARTVEHEMQVQRLDGVRVLVVDDSDIILEIVQRILENQGAIVTRCSDGAAAVEYVRAHHGQLDVILIDVQMPLLDGNEATRRIRGELGVKALPIIGLTAGALTRERQRSLDAGMNDVITKPFDVVTFLRKMRQVVERGAAGP